MGGKNEFLKHIAFRLGNRNGIRSWEDTWLGYFPLAVQYPSLYSIVRHKNVTVVHVLAQTQPNILFRMSLVGDKRTAWLQMVERLMSVSLSMEPDSYVWKLTPSGVFLVKSLYMEHMNGTTRVYKKYLWKLKMPLNIKLVMWFQFLDRKVLLTKDNPLKRQWTRNVCYVDRMRLVSIFLSLASWYKIWRLIYFTFNITPPGPS